MNPRNMFRLAWIFCLSAARVKRSSGGSPDGLKKKPVTNIYVSLVGFSLAAVFTYYIIGPNMDTPTLVNLASQLNIFLPAYAVFMSMVYSLMTEFSISGEIASTDMLNWLPIQAGDFVMGSVLTTIYFVSPMISIILGVTFGLSSIVSTLSIWVLSSILGVFSCFLGALVLEIVRGAMNKVSGSFSSLRGQWAVILRIILSVTIIVMISMFFNFTMMMRIVGSFTTSIEGIRFVPVFWPSMIVLKQVSGDSIGAFGYATLSSILLFAIYNVSISVRKRYWEPIPFSIKFQNARKSKDRGLLDYLKLNSAEIALIHKDLKSLVRRREMAYLLAIPVIIILMGIMGTPLDVLMNASTPFDVKTTFLYMCAMSIVVLVLQTSLNAFGQEREAFINLVASPLDQGQILSAKFAFAFLPVLPIIILFDAILSQITEIDSLTLIVLTIMGLITLMAVSSVELAVGIRYANFSSVVRTQFVSQSGRLIGLTFCVVSIGILATPLALHFLYGSINVYFAFILMVLFAWVIIGVSFKIAHRELDKLYEYDY